MQKYRRLLRGRAIFLLIDLLVIIFFLTAWMIARKAVPIEQTISYNSARDHILVQIAKLPDDHHVAWMPQGYTEPKWTLYGDGTLIFQAEPGDSLWRAQLSPHEIQHILDVIINQNTFFACTAQQYGSLSLNRGDDDARLLMVDANGQQKKVVLTSNSTDQATADIQTTHVFAIEQFLLGYHPGHTFLYAPDPDNAFHDKKW